MALISINDVYKSFGATPVLTGIDLEMTVVAVIGRSGSGKSTLLPRFLSHAI